MKKIILGFILVSGFMLQKADAQVRVGVNINIGDQPEWGPRGYDYAQYYYFPDIDVYYDVPRRQFIYFDGRDWEFAYSLPSYYRDFDLYRSYKVVINEPRPYLRNDEFTERYYQYRGYHNQEVIRERREENYEHNYNRYPQNRYDRDNHYGDYRRNGDDRDKGWGKGSDRDDHNRRGRD